MELCGLEQYCKENNIPYKKDEPMRLHTSFKIGGPADIFICPGNTAELSSVLKRCRELTVPFFIIGNGSNLLVSDGGIEGAVISVSSLNKITVCGEEIKCGAGAGLSSVCKAALDNSLTGLEFAYGIPGSVGGALYMNAGAYGGEMADAVISAEYVTEDGTAAELTAEEMNLGYRSSVFKNGGMVITSVTLKLSGGDKERIQEKMSELIMRRKQKQPLEYPSAGSTFKRPVGNYAGALIEKNGLKGASAGGAQVSDKHAGFIVNLGNATCKDVCELIKRVQTEVLNGDGVKLEPEVILVGRSEN